jgi:hypothetical protein
MRHDTRWHMDTMRAERRGLVDEYPAESSVPLHEPCLEGEGQAECYAVTKELTHDADLCPVLRFFWSLTVTSFSLTVPRARA